MKAHVHHPWQNYSSCKVNQAQASLSARPSKVRPAHTQIPTTIETAGALSHQATTCLIRSENGLVSTRGWILSPQAEVPSFLKWHKAEGDVTKSWESFNQLSLLSSPTQLVKNQEQPWSELWSSWNDIKSAHFHPKNVYSQVHEPSTWTPNGKT